MKLESMLRLGNEDIGTGSGGTYEHRNPVSGESQGLIPLAGRDEIDRAVAKAVAAFEGWRRWKPADRRDAMQRLAALVKENVSNFARLAAHDGGTTLPAATVMAEIAAEWHAYYAGWPDKLDGQVLSSFEGRGEFAYTVPQPYGVIGVIITWNGPVVSLGMKVAPALAAGNCVVVKPAEMTPFVPDLYARLVREAGIPDGVLSMLPGGPDAGEALVAHRDVEKISFTGGPASARRILVACAEQMKPVVLELGGKSANIVFPDADLDRVAATAVFSSVCVMAGQGCALATRLILHETIHDELLGKIVGIIKSLKVGDPFEPGIAVGPLINAQACDRVMGMLDRVRSEGSGAIVVGGNRCGGDLAGKNFIEPTVIAGVDPQSEIAQTEVFGPVLVVHKFASEEEAINLANATRYGLAAYIQSNDAKRVHRVAERLKSGGVYVNGAYSLHPSMPFGGLGISGYGKEGGRVGIDEFLRYKTVALA